MKIHFFECASILWQRTPSSVTSTAHRRIQLERKQTDSETCLGWLSFEWACDYSYLTKLKKQFHKFTEQSTQTKPANQAKSPCEEEIILFLEKNINEMNKRQAQDFFAISERFCLMNHWMRGNFWIVEASTEPSGTTFNQQTTKIRLVVWIIRFGVLKFVYCLKDGSLTEQSTDPVESKSKLPSRETRLEILKERQWRRS